MRIKKKIGLLGGSFNPAHEGHIYISKQAKELLKLDEIWWLVSPNHPTKPSEQMASFDSRVTSAEVITKELPYIKISDFESLAGTKFTCDTILEIKKDFPNDNFVWLMGADNLENFHLWKNWRNILKLVPVAILDRIPYSPRALASTAAISYSGYRIHDLEQLVAANLPAWGYIHIKPMDISSTEIRGEKND